MHTISINVTSETNLYEPFDPTGGTLSAGLRDYIGSFVEDRELGQEVRLELVCKEPIDKARFEEAYRGHVDTLVRRCKSSRKKRSGNAVRMLATGAAFVLAGLLLAGRGGPVLAAIISTIGSFSIWEAAAIWLEDMPSLRKRERALAVYRRAEILVRERKPEDGN